MNRRDNLNKKKFQEDFANRFAHKRLTKLIDGIINDKTKLNEVNKFIDSLN